MAAAEAYAECDLRSVALESARASSCDVGSCLSRPRCSAPPARTRSRTSTCSTYARATASRERAERGELVRRDAGDVILELADGDLARAHRQHDPGAARGSRDRRRRGRRRPARRRARPCDGACTVVARQHERKRHEKPGFPCCPSARHAPSYQKSRPAGGGAGEARYALTFERRFEASASTPASRRTSSPMPTNRYTSGRKL